MPGFKLAIPTSTANSCRPPATTQSWSWSATPARPSAREALRTLLYLFERDEAAKLIRAG